MTAPIHHAVKDFFRRLVWRGAAIPVVTAGPDRAYVEIRRWLARTKRISLERAKEQPIPYPWCSVKIEDPVFDSARFSPAKIRGFDVDVERGTAKAMKVPKPLTAGIQADLWFKNEHQAKHIGDQLELQFWDDETALPVNFADPKWYKKPYELLEHMKVLGQTRFWLKKTSALTDNSDLETTGKRRAVRKTFVGELRYDLPHVPYMGKILRTLNVQVIDEEADALLEEWDIPINGGT